MEKTLRYLENDRVHDPTIPRRVAESSEFGIRVHPHVINDRSVYSERTTKKKCDIALFTIHLFNFMHTIHPSSPTHICRCIDVVNTIQARARVPTHTTHKYTHIQVEIEFWWNNSLVMDEKFSTVIAELTFYVK